MPFSKRTYSFRQGASNESENNSSGLSTPLRKIKSRGRTFIGGKTPTTDNSQEESGISLSPFTRGSVRLRSIRKRKMANRDDVKNEVTSFKREKLVEKKKDEIEVKIEENIRMRDGITKLLGGCHDTRQAMDIGKNLLTINSRILSLMSSLQKKRSSNILKDFNKGQGIHQKTYEPCFGDLAVSEIRIPLLWKQDAHFKSKAGEQPALLYHMFCLLKINDQVFDTPLVKFNQIDTDVTFNDVFTFHDIHPDFKLELEVYYSVINNPDNPVWTPIRTPKKNVYSSAPKFCLAAHAQLTVDDVKDAFVVSDFTMGGIGASATAVLGQVDDLPDNPLALWGQYSCQLHARPACFLKQDLDGHLLLQSCNGGEPLWEKYYCRLRNGSVQCWKNNLGKDEEFSMTPTLFVALKKNMKLHTETNVDNSGRCLITLTKKGSDKKESVFAFENEEEFEKWKKNLQEAILNIAAWKTENYTLMNLEEFEAKKIAFNKVMNYFDQHKVDNKQASPGLARKVAKNSFYLSEHTPKVKSFYDQIKIEEKKDLADDQPASVEVYQDKELFESSTEKGGLNSKSETDYCEDTAVFGGNENMNSLVQKEEIAVVVEDEINHGTTEQHRDDDDDWDHIEEYELMQESVEITANSLENPVIAEDSVVLEKNEKVAEDVNSQRDEEAVEEDEEQPQKGDVGAESVVELDVELGSTEKRRDSLVENLEGTVEESIEETEKANDDLDICEGRDVSKIEEKLDDVSIGIKKDDDDDDGDDSVLEKKTDETEESVMDYFMETINFAAELDECSDSFFTEESSQKIVIDENGLGDDMQTGLSESELQDNVCDGSEADNAKPLETCSDYEISSIEDALEENQENSEDKIEMERTEGDSFLVGESNTDVDIKECDADSSHNICVQTDELTEVIPANIDTEKELSCEEQDASNISSDISETEPCQEATAVLGEKLADKSERFRPIEPVSSPTLEDPGANDFAEFSLDPEVLDEEGVECNQEDALEVETVKQNEPVDCLSRECELTTDGCTEQAIMKDDVIESDIADANRKIETDV